MYRLSSLTLFLLSVSLAAIAPAQSSSIPGSNAALSKANAPKLAEISSGSRKITYFLPKPGGDPDVFVDEAFRRNELDKSGNAVAATVLNNWAVALAKRSYLEEAAAALRRAASLDARPEFYLNLSIVYDLLNRHEDAGFSAAKGVEIAPTDPRLRGQLCVTDIYTNQFSAAAGCLEEMRKLGPLDDYYSTAYGIALLRSGGADKAIEILEKVVQTTPQNYTAQNSLGMAYFMQKDYQKAGERFKYAIELAPELGQARYNLAIVQLMRQNRAGALSQYKLLQESSPKIADKLSRVLFKDKVLFVGNK